MKLGGYIVLVGFFLLVANAHAQTFVHPGILISKAQLQETQLALEEKEPVATEAYRALLTDPRARLDYEPKPWSSVECGPYSNPNRGCRDEFRDAQAAYTHALLWFYLQDSTYAEKAVEIMNAWSSTLTGGHANSNAALQAAWSAQMWTRAAEIIRYTSTSWSEEQALGFGQWLQSQYLPDIMKVSACHYGNWQASTLEARLNIAVYNDDKPLFDQAIADWRRRLPAFIYLAEDGNLPFSAPGCNNPPNNDVTVYWQGQNTFTSIMSGLAQETCRDLEHTAYGLAGFINVAQTAYIQDVDLYAEQSARLMAAMEFHSKWAFEKSVPLWLCKGKLKGDLAGTFEIGYRHYSDQANELPMTKKWLQFHRPSRGYFHYLWETLTHGRPL